MSRIVSQWAGKADHLFQAVARAIYRNPLKALVFVLLLVGLGVSGLPDLRKDGRIEAFMHETDPALQAYYDMRHSFGQDNRIVVTVWAPDVFTTPFLTRLAELHRDIQRDVPYIAELFSLYNIPFIQYEDGGIYLEELVRNMLHRQWDPHDMRDRIMATPLYRNFILSEDGKTASIIIEPYRYAPDPNDCIARPEQGISCDNAFRPAAERRLLGPPQYAEMAAKVRSITATYQDPATFDIHVSGAPMISTEIVALMSKDMPRFTLLCIGVTILVILVLYRSFLVAIAALFVVAASVLVTFGLMARFGVALTPPTQMLIPLLLVVSLCIFVHFVAGLFRAHHDTGSKPAALTLAMTRSHAPIVFSALTTAAGLVGFTTSTLAPVSFLGLFGAVGTMIAYVLGMAMSVLVFRVLSDRFFKRRSKGFPVVVRAMTALSLAAARRPRRVLAAVAGIGLASGVGLQALEYSHNSLLWLPDTNKVRLDTERINDTFKGTVNLEVIVRPRAGLDFRNEELMRRLDDAAIRVHGMTDVPIGRHTSIIDFLKVTNQALNEGDPAHHVVPTQQEIWDELLLLESQGTDDMVRYATLSYDAGRLTFLTPWLEAKRFTDFIHTVQSTIEEAIGDLAEVRTTGLVALLAMTSTAVLTSMTSSYTVVLALVTLLMCIVLRSLRLGLLSMIPNIGPFLVLLSIMGILGIPLDTFTILIGGIITGLIVDDTTHFFYQYKRNLRDTGATDPAIRATIAEIGVPIFTTTVVIMAGFAVFHVSSLNNLQIFGLLMMIGAPMALIADLIIAPALLVLFAGGSAAPVPDSVSGAETAGEAGKGPVAPAPEASHAS